MGSKAFEVIWHQCTKATDAFNFKGEESYKKAGLGFLGFLAYVIVIARFAFFIKRAAHYEENLRATEFFETNLD